MKRAVCMCVLIAAIFCIPGSPAMAFGASSADVYPERIAKSEDGSEIRKEYVLSAGESPRNIPRDDYYVNGLRYVLTDILRTDEKTEDSRKHTETVTFTSASSDTEVLLPMISDKMAFTSPDGYRGELLPDFRSLKIEANAGSGTKNISAQRSYPSLADADMAHIPKSINENGKELTLSDIVWQTDNTMNRDDYEIADRYTATATYTGSARTGYVKDYTVSVDFTGEITKTIGESNRYIAVFAAEEPVAKHPDFIDRFSVFPLLIGAAVLLLALLALPVFKKRKRKEIEKNGTEKIESEEIADSGSNPVDDSAVPGCDGDPSICGNGHGARPGAGTLW